ncbi:YggS family pyridoxal phosphate-dependent enzyme [bacterium]|nr:YggS family pyridoxal phosphate-dependent enzyme [bacterium]
MSKVGAEVVAEVVAGVKARYDEICLRISAAQARSRHERSVRLVAVSKRQPIERVRALQEALVDRRKGSSELLLLGENYVQEYAEKRDLLLPHFAHLIGPLQSNKAKAAVSLFSCIESVHRKKTAEVLQREAEKQGVRPAVLLQVNISADPEKAGFLPEEFLELLPGWAEQFPALQLHGGMTITAHHEASEAVREDYRRMNALVLEGFERYRESFVGDLVDDLPVVSMGMSGDFEIAIEEGASLVRIGSALFGARTT